MKSYLKIFSIFSLILALSFGNLNAVTAHDGEDHTNTLKEEFVLPKAGKLPGEFGYWFKVTGERLKMFFTFNGQEKAELRIKLAERRLAEINELWNEEKLKPYLAEKLTRKYVISVNKAVNSFNSADQLQKTADLLNSHYVFALNMQSKMAENQQLQTAIDLIVQQSAQVRIRATQKLLSIDSSSAESILSQAKNEIGQLKSLVEETKEKVNQAETEAREVTAPKQQLAIAQELLRQLENRIASQDASKTFELLQNVKFAIASAKTSVDYVLERPLLKLTPEQIAKVNQQNNTYKGGGTAPYSTGDVVVFMQNNSFAPNNIEISAGTTVIFKNDDNKPRWPKSDQLAGFDAGKEIAAGETWSYTFNTPGTYEYYDVRDGTVTGTIVVR